MIKDFISEFKRIDIPYTIGNGALAAVGLAALTLGGVNAAQEYEDLQGREYSYPEEETRELEASLFFAGLGGMTVAIAVGRQANQSYPRVLEEE